MQQKHISLQQFELPELLSALVASDFDGVYDPVKHVVSLESPQGVPIGHIRLPLHVVLSDQLDIVDEEAVALYLTVESGNAAICVMEGKAIDYHTTFSAYMTRKKQGFSQIKYLNKKGKSRAGSRVRLAATVEFFEKINTCVTALMEEYEPDRLALSCTTTLVPYLYQSRVPFPVPKKDPLLYKIPMHIPQSNYTNLDAAIKKLQVPTLFYWEQRESEVREFLEDIAP